VEFFGALQRTAKPLEFKFAGGDLSGSNCGWSPILRPLSFGVEIVGVSADVAVHAVADLSALGSVAVWSGRSAALM
jgi:hypothetical protein